MQNYAILNKYLDFNLIYFSLATIYSHRNQTPSIWLTILLLNCFYLLENTLCLVYPLSKVFVSFKLSDFFQYIIVCNTDLNGKCWGRYIIALSWRGKSSWCFIIWYQLLFFKTLLPPWKKLSHFVDIIGGLWFVP